MKLSILIPSTPDRNDTLIKLISHLSDQIVACNALGKVEVLVEEDNYLLSIGTKRNILLYKALGEYICFVDSDDRVADYYVEEILKGIETNPDCISLIGEYRKDGGEPQTFIHSLDYNRWFEKDKILYRNPNHLNVVKATIARKILFPEISHGEDHDYSKRLLQSGLLKTEYKIDKVLYYYDFISNKKAQTNGNIRTRKVNIRNGRTSNRN